MSTEITPTPTTTITSTPTPSLTITATATPKPTATSTQTPTTTKTASATPTNTPPSTATATPTSSPTSTASSTPQPTSTATSNFHYKNKRIFYAIQAVAADPIDSSGVHLGQKLKLQGLQSVAIDTKFNLEPISQFGTLEIYDNTRSATDVTVTLSKIVDNKPPLYLMLSQGTLADSNNKNIYDLSPRKTDIYLGIWPDTNIFASGSGIQTLMCKDMFIAGIEYDITYEKLLETVSLQGYHKAWFSEVYPADPVCPTPTANQKPCPTPTTTHTRAPIILPTSICCVEIPGVTPTPTRTQGFLEPQNPQGGGPTPTPTERAEEDGTPPDSIVVAKGYSLDFANSIFPTGSGGIYGSGIADLRILSINVKCEVDRGKVYELGQIIPVQNPVINPATITCSIEMIMSAEELKQFNNYNNQHYVASLVNDQSKHPVVYDVKHENNWWTSGTKLIGPNGNEYICSTEIPKHTFDKTILLKIKNCNDITIKNQEDTDDVYLDLGNENRMSSIDYTTNVSGDTTIVRYTLKNYNTFKIRHTKVVKGGRFDVSSSIPPTKTKTSTPTPTPTKTPANTPSTTNTKTPTTTVTNSPSPTQTMTASPTTTPTSGTTPTPTPSLTATSTITPTNTPTNTSTQTPTTTTTLTSTPTSTTTTTLTSTPTKTSTPSPTNS